MIINTREDLDSIKGTPEHEIFMAGLRGSLFQLQKDDSLQEWVLLEDNSTIEQFGFKRADFEPIELPAVPAYKPDNSETLQQITELKQKLADTDYKDLPSYKPKEGELIEEVIAQRDAWREEIRVLESEINK
jgi:hypothetical protein